MLCPVRFRDDRRSVDPVSFIKKEVNDAIGHFSDVVHIPGKLILRFAQQDEDALVNCIVDFIQPINMVIGQF